MSDIKWGRGPDVLGCTPNQTDISYFGFTTRMDPAEYLKLVYATFGDFSWQVREQLGAAVDEGRQIAPPYLCAEWVPQIKLWKVTQFDGRARAALAHAAGETDIPVDIFPKGEISRARQLTDEMKSARFVTAEDADKLVDMESLAGELGEIREDGPNDLWSSLPPSDDLAGFLKDEGFDAVPIKSCFNIAVDVNIGTRVVKLRNDTSTIYGGKWITFIYPPDVPLLAMFDRMLAHVSPGRSRAVIVKALNFAGEREIDQLGSLGDELKSMEESILALTDAEYEMQFQTRKEVRNIVDELAKAGYEAKNKGDYAELVVNKVEFSIIPISGENRARVRVMPLIGAPANLMWPKGITCGPREFIKWMEGRFNDHADGLDDLAKEMGE